MSVLENGFLSDPDYRLALGAAAETAGGHVHSAICPDCGGAMGVRDSRLSEFGLIRRRRACAECSMRFTTYEIPARLLLALLDRPGALDRVTPTALAAEVARRLGVEKEGQAR